MMLENWLDCNNLFHFSDELLESQIGKTHLHIGERKVHCPWAGFQALGPSPILDRLSRSLIPLQR